MDSIKIDSELQLVCLTHERQEVKNDEVAPPPAATVIIAAEAASSILTAAIRS